MARFILPVVHEHFLECHTLLPRMDCKLQFLATGFIPSNSDILCGGRSVQQLPCLYSTSIEMAASQQAQPAPESLNNSSTLENGQVEASNEEEVWDEERIEKALNTLKEMHIQVILAPAKHTKISSLILKTAQRSANHHTTTYCAPLFQTAIAYATHSLQVHGYLALKSTKANFE